MSRTDGQLFNLIRSEKNAELLEVQCVDDNSVSSFNEKVPQKILETFEKDAITSVFLSTLGDTDPVLSASTRD